MKTLVLLCILLPAIAFSQNTGTKTTATQESLKKSAETFVTNWLKNWETKKWDEILIALDENGSNITSVQTSSLTEEVKSLIEYYKKNVASDKIFVKSFSTEILGPSAAIVTARYQETTDRLGKISTLDNLDIILLGMKDGVWKIKNYYPQYNYPVIFSDKIDKEWQKGKLDLNTRFTGAVNQMGSMSYYFLEDYKKNGTSPAQVGKSAGTRFAKFWDQSRGFEGLVAGILSNLQTMSTYIEVLERNGSIAKIKFAHFKQPQKSWDVTDQEILEYYQNIFGEIATHMGGTSSVVNEGEFLVLTLTKKL
jgi:hypothetical protein